MNKELLMIKKHYGEKMMHLCTTLFPTILEHRNLLFNLLEKRFAFSKFLYDDIVAQNKVDEFKNYLLSHLEKDENLIHTNKDPETLLEEAGYILYECKDEKDVGKFRKYYSPKEILCTFYSNRTYDHYVFFAVKKNVQFIKREDFLNPSREDLYGTSVISIQFTKGGINSLSIKNRYNHVVDNADATFSNNLDNIIPGLTDSFQKKYHLNIFPEECSFELLGYCCDESGKYYKYNYEINDIYYCPNNIIIDKASKIEFAKEKYIIADYFVIDLVNKTIRLYDDLIDEDGFINNFTINKIVVLNQEYGKRIIINGDTYYVNLDLDKFNRIIGYKSNIKKIGNNFLYFNRTIKKISNSELLEIGNDFLPYNDTLLQIDTINIQEIGNSFLEQNTSLTNVNFPNLKKVGNYFLRNTSLTELNLPNLETVQHGFLSFNKVLRKIELPKLTMVGNYFLSCNSLISTISFPNLETVGKSFLTRNSIIKKINLPKLMLAGDDFLTDNKNLSELHLPSIIDIGNNFLSYNQHLKSINLPKILRIGDDFLYMNEDLSYIKLPLVLSIGDNFLKNNIRLMEIDLENVEIIGLNFLYNNSDIAKALIPRLKICGDCFLHSAINLSEYNFDAIEKKGIHFLYMSNENFKNKLVKKKQI